MKKNFYNGQLKNISRCQKITCKICELKNL